VSDYWRYFYVSPKLTYKINWSWQKRLGYIQDIGWCGH